MKIKGPFESPATDGLLDQAIDPKQVPPATQETGDATADSVSEQEIEERLAGTPVGKDIYQMITRSDESLLRRLQRRIAGYVYGKVPVVNWGDLYSAISDHLVDTILRKTGNDLRPDAVRRCASHRKFEYLFYEVKMRLIDEARKASAQKRGGDGKHIPRFDSLTIEGEPESRPDEASDSAQSDAQRRRPIGSRVEHQCRDMWHRFTENIRREELTSDPRIDSELGEAARFYRFHLEHPDEGLTDRELARELGVTTRTIRNYRRKVASFLQKDPL